jgi:hypothetical protein
MRDPDYLNRAKLNPARTFKSPMDVVEMDDFEPAEKLAILEAWESDERALLRAEDEGMGGGEHAHLHKVQAALDHLRGEPCPSLDIGSVIHNPSTVSRIAAGRRGAERAQNREKTHA